ncbi:MAG: hypothetical protein KDE28_22375, partial [Anaerolineales bacterium]|nr:hypothetical protein [Anaerolineales bacterium]
MELYKHLIKGLTGVKQILYYPNYIEFNIVYLEKICAIKADAANEISGANGRQNTKKARLNRPSHAVLAVAGAGGPMVAAGRARAGGPIIGEPFSMSIWAPG